MLISFEEIFEQRKFYAHTSKNKDYEYLEEHMERTKNAYDQFIQKKRIDKLIKNILQVISNDLINEDELSFLYDSFVYAIYLHDIGKINPKFQKDKMNQKHINNAEGNSQHSLPSALIYCDIFMEKISSFKNKRLLAFFIFSFSYCISRHHSYLNSMKDFTEQLGKTKKFVKKYIEISINTEKNKYTDILDGMDNFIKKYEIKEIDYYILLKLLYSLICACDYYATSEYYSSKKPVLNVIDDIQSVYNKYINDDIYKNIQLYKVNKDHFKDKPINALRSDMFLEVEESILKNLDANIFYLEAPTGSGKTNMSFNLALQMIRMNMSLNNIYYIFPFNTLSEQTAEVLRGYFINKNDMVVLNSVTPIITNKEYSMEDNEVRLDYDTSYLNKQFINYPVVLTSHVNFFNTLFGCGVDSNIPLFRLANSVIILDEIQSYRNEIWRQMIIFINRYAQLLNMKIIIMSATLPRLDKLLNNDHGKFIPLIRDSSKYYNNSLFKNRVKIDYSLLKYKKIDFEHLAAKMFEHKDKKVLVEFISKNSARQFYDFFIQYCKAQKINIITDQDAIEEDKENENGISIIELTGDDNKLFRKKAISRIKNSKRNLTVIATQVIEAGVDIDMDVGFKDISNLDSEEQFLGRINRSCLKNGQAFFFNYDEVTNIYYRDLRTRYTLKNTEIQDILDKKDFNEYYNLVLMDLMKATESYNDKNIVNLYHNAINGNYKSIQQQMQLIHGGQQLVLGYVIQTDKGEINGKEIWKQYKKISEDANLTFAEKKINLSFIYEQLSYFSYSIFLPEQKEPHYYDEYFGGFYFVENGERFMKNGKFNRSTYMETGNGRFL